MTSEEKQLVLQDLCARLPYGVKVTWDNKHSLTVTPHIYCAIASEKKIDNTPKLLLRPMSSMTEEEKKELKFMCDIGPETLTDSSWVNGEFGLSIIYKNKASIRVDAFDWLNKKMFDYRGLIPKGLAISTEEFNPYKD